MNPSTQAFSFPAVRRAIQSVANVPLLEFPTHHADRPAQPRPVVSPVRGFVLASGAANTAFAQNATYRATEIVNRVWGSNMLPDHGEVNYYRLGHGR